MTANWREKKNEGVAKDEERKSASVRVRVRRRESESECEGVCRGGGGKG